MDPYDHHVSLDCYVRASATAEPVDEITETLRRYAKDGIINEFAVEFWPDEIRLTDDAVNSPVVDRYERFRAWADDDDVSLAPGFVRRTRSSMIDGDATFLVLPVLCLATRIDGELVNVAPHSTGSAVYTVEDALTDVGAISESPVSEYLDELPPDHPVRSATASGINEHQSHERDETLSER